MKKRSAFLGYLFILTFVITSFSSAQETSPEFQFPKYACQFQVTRVNKWLRFRPLVGEMLSAKIHLNHHAALRLGITSLENKGETENFRTKASRQTLPEFPENNKNIPTSFICIIYSTHSRIALSNGIWVQEQAPVSSLLKTLLAVINPNSQQPFTLYLCLQESNGSLTGILA